MSFDIREYKTKLRSRFKAERAAMTAEEKKLLDEKILSRILSSKAYEAADTVLTYVSTDIEVDTHGLIAQAVKDG